MLKFSRCHNICSDTFGNHGFFEFLPDKFSRTWSTPTAIVLYFPFFFSFILGFVVCFRDTTTFVRRRVTRSRRLPTPRRFFSRYIIRLRRRCIMLTLLMNLLQAVIVVVNSRIVFTPMTAGPCQTDPRSPGLDRGIHHGYSPHIFARQDVGETTIFRSFFLLPPKVFSCFYSIHFLELKQ